VTPTAPASTLLEGRVCVVSGVAARRQATLDDVAAEVEALGRRVVAVSTNITDAAQCERVIAAAVDELGGVDVVVNNAFRQDVFQSFEEVDLATWRKIVDVNLFGSLQMTRAAVPSMRQRGGGSVVMVASMVTRRPQPLQGGYTVSKGALLTATRVLASELGPANIRVNAVVPGWMQGPSVDIYVQMTSEGSGVSPDEVIAEIAGRIPLGRVPTDAEVAGSIVFLASDLSAAVTGQAVDANGGEHFA
jgi:NAD(P)-dependent dehydrogenase (short-subunit alcohol dehydrogenase family)